MIRTTEQLTDRIAEDLVWRRKELTELRGAIQAAEGKLHSKVLMRAAVAILYAHWEGFVKKAASNYLEFVASHRLPYRKLAPNFISLALRSKFRELSKNERLTAANSLAEFMISQMESKSNVPYKNVIDTKSNLSSTVFEEILAILGLDRSLFATRLNFIDANLVNVRNHIAHGEALFLNTKEYLELHDEVIALIETFRNEVENCSVLKTFERNVA